MSTKHPQNRVHLQQHGSVEAEDGDGYNVLTSVSIIRPGRKPVDGKWMFCENNLPAAEAAFYDARWRATQLLF